MKPLPLVLIAALSAAALPATPLRAESAAAAAAPAAEISLPAITVSQAAVRKMTDRVVGSGLVAPVERVLVQPLIEGQPIEDLLVEVGDRVKAGEVLARLSDSSLRLQESQFAAQRASAAAAIAQTEAQLLEAKSTSEEAARVAARTKALRAQGSSSQAALDTAQSNAVSAAARVTVAEQSLAAAQAELALVDAQIADLKLQLSRTEVIAPVGGEVVQRNAMVGAIATAAGDPMFAIIRDSALELRADVPERFMLKVKPGQSAVMTGVGQSTPMTGTVRLVEPSIELTTRLGQARISIDDSASVRVGMFLSAEILVAEREAVTVPLSAVGATEEGATVMKVVDGTVERVLVDLGIRDGAHVEVLSGLSAGDTVVTKAAAFVRDGDKINPVPDTAGTN
jgi:HlyD family secretion protein